MVEIRDYKGIKYASAKELYDYLVIKEKFSTWIKLSIKNTNIKEYKDFVVYKKQSTGGRPLTDYLLSKNAALKVVLQSRVKKSMELADILIDVWDKKEKGIYLNVDQIAAITDMVKAMTLVSVQKKSETKHFNYLGRPKDWWTYRAGLLGYSKDSLQKALKEVGKKYKSQKQALIHLDPSEIIRTGVVDLLIALGKNKEYALNVAEFAKVICEKNDYHLEIWDDTKPNPLNLNEPTVTERKVRI